MDTVTRKAADYDADVPRYDVLVDGVVIGQVFRAWWRNGGAGWGTSAHGSSVRVADTRKAAVAALARRSV